MVAIYTSQGKEKCYTRSPTAEKTINGLLKEGHNIKLEKCTEDCFILLAVITAKRDGLATLVIISKLINRQIFHILSVFKVDLQTNLMDLSIDQF